MRIFTCPCGSATHSGEFLWLVWLFNPRQQWIHRDITTHTLCLITVRCESNSSNPQLHVPAKGSCHSPAHCAPQIENLPFLSNQMCSSNPLTMEIKVFYLLLTGKFPHCSCQWQTLCLKSAAECTNVWEWPAWFPRQTKNELLSQAKAVQKQQVTGRKSLLSGDPLQPFFSQKSLLPPTAEFKKEKLPKPKEVAR